MRVLILEGADFMAKVFDKVLKHHGHQPERIKKVTRRGKKFAFKYGNYRTLKRDVDVVLVDCFSTDPVKGTAIVRHFAKQQIPCVGISAIAEANVPLVKAGATLSLTKAAALIALFTGDLSLEQVRNSPQQQQSLVPSLEELPKNKELRRKLDALITEA